MILAIILGHGVMTITDEDFSRGCDRDILLSTGAGGQCYGLTPLEKLKVQGHGKTY